MRGRIHRGQSRKGLGIVGWVVAVGALFAVPLIADAKLASAEEILSFEAASVEATDLDLANAAFACGTEINCCDPDTICYKSRDKKPDET